MRYELYEWRNENTFVFLCEDDDLGQIKQTFSYLSAENAPHYIVLDNEGESLIVHPTDRMIPPEEWRRYIFACKRCKFLCINSRDIVLDWDAWLFRAYDEACAFAERETAAIFHHRKDPHNG